MSLRGKCKRKVFGSAFFKRRTGHGRRPCLRSSAKRKSFKKRRRGRKTVRWTVFRGEDSPAVRGRCRAATEGDGAVKRLAGGSPYNPLFFNGFCIVLCASHLGNPLIGFPKPFLIFSDDKEFRRLRSATKGFAFGNHNPFEKGLTESFFLRLRSER